jgi:hypothetical protein
MKMITTKSTQKIAIKIMMSQLTKKKTIMINLQNMNV